MNRATVTRKRRSRHSRKLQIMRVLYYWNYHEGLTMTRIAFWMQICPSTHLLGILGEMASEGFLSVSEAQHRPNSIKKIWKLAPFGERSAEFHKNVPELAL